MLAVMSSFNLMCRLFFNNFFVYNVFPQILYLRMWPHPWKMNYKNLRIHCSLLTAITDWLLLGSIIVVALMEVVVAEGSELWYCTGFCSSLGAAHYRQPSWTGCCWALVEVVLVALVEVVVALGSELRTWKSTNVLLA